MAMSNTGTFTFPMPVTIHNRDSVTISYDSTTSDVFVVNGTTTTGGKWMAHPMTADEIIDQAARELARKRPAD